MFLLLSYKSFRDKSIPSDSSFFKDIEYKDKRVSKILFFICNLKAFLDLKKCSHKHSKRNYPDILTNVP